MARILVVDDERSIKEALSMALGKKGYSIDTACDGFDALRKMHEDQYDLVLTDIRMPNMDGVQLIKAMRKEGQNTPVIVLSAYTNAETASLVIKDGVKDIIIKPFDLSALYKSIDYALDPKILEKSLKSVQQHDITGNINKIYLLNTLSEKLRPLQDRQVLLDTFCEKLHDTYNADRVVIELYPTVDTQLLRQVSWPKTNELTEEQKAFERWLIENVKAQSKSVLINNIHTNHQLKKRFSISHGSVLAVPLRSVHQLMGVALMFKQRENDEFSQDCLNSLPLLADHMAVKFDLFDREEENTNNLTDAIHSVFTTLEAKHYLTFTHAARVACYALLLAKQLKLSEKEQRDLEYMALLHDVGKIAVPVQLLDKLELSDEEQGIMKHHVFVGEDILRPMRFLPGGDKVIRHHHEAYDGSGYPDHLKGETIPLYSRIIYIVNDFDHFTTELAVQDRMGQHEAMEKMMRQAGKLYDPKLLQMFISSYRNILMKK